MIEIQKNITLFNKYVNRNNPKFIVLHSTNNNLSAKENSNLYSEEHLGYSIHYFVDEETVIQMVNDEDSALHIQDGYVNGQWITDINIYNSLSITMCPMDDDSIVDDLKTNVIELLKLLMEKYEIDSDNIFRHYDCTGKICPSYWAYNDWEEWWKFKEELGSLSMYPSVKKMNIVKTFNKLDNNIFEDEIDTEKIEFIRDIEEEYDDIESTGTFLTKAFLKVRVKPTLTSNHVMTIQPNQAFDFDRIYRANGYEWLSFLNDDLVRWYAPIRSYDLASGEEGELNGFILTN